MTFTFWSLHWYQKYNTIIDGTSDRTTGEDDAIEEAVTINDETVGEVAEQDSLQSDPEKISELCEKEEQHHCSGCSKRICNFLVSRIHTLQMKW